FSTKSGNPELHSGLPCGVPQGFPTALTLSFAPAMRPLQRPRPSLLRLMPASGFRVPVPVTSGSTGGKFENFKKMNCFFKTITLSLLLCPVPCLHFDCSF
ncbi:unnamed protein product, partial [Staurois parvus]